MIISETFLTDSLRAHWRAGISWDEAAERCIPPLHPMRAYYRAQWVFWDRGGQFVDWPPSEPRARSSATI